MAIMMISVDYSCICILLEYFDSMVVLQPCPKPVIIFEKNSEYKTGLIPPWSLQGIQGMSALVCFLLVRN